MTDRTKVPTKAARASTKLTIRSVSRGPCA